MVTFRHFQPKRTRHIAIYVLLLIAVFVILGVLRNCKGPDSLAPVEKGYSGGDTLDVAVVYGPGSYFLNGDTLAGANYEMLTRMRDSLKWPIRLWPVVSAAETLPALESGQYDIIASMPSDSDLKQRFLTTREVWLDKLVLVQKKKNGAAGIISALDLAGDTIHVERGSSAERRLHNLMREIGDTIHLVTEDGIGEEYLGIGVATGRYKYAVINEKTAKLLQSGRYSDLDFSTPVAFTQFQVWVIRGNDTTLLGRLNAAIDSIAPM